jgi:hypothetical protein
VGICGVLYQKQYNGNDGASDFKNGNSTHVNTSQEYSIQPDSSVCGPRSTASTTAAWQLQPQIRQGDPVGKVFTYQVTAKTRTLIVPHFHHDGLHPIVRENQKKERNATCLSQNEAMWEKFITPVVQVGCLTLPSSCVAQTRLKSDLDRAQSGIWRPLHLGNSRSMEYTHNPKVREAPLIPCTICRVTVRVMP